MMRIIGGPRPSEVGCGILKNQICEAPRISQNNLWVMLHWARMALCRRSRGNSGPSFGQDDPRWSDVRLGPSTDTLGDEGCAVTSAAMVAAFYGIKTDPQQLNAFLTRTGGFTDDGLIHWRRVPSIAPARWELAYNGGPSYKLIDSNLLAGNPIIALIPLPDGGYHFVVIVGKEGEDYLIRDPAASPLRRAYHLRDLTDRIAGLVFFRTMRSGVNLTH
jgi:Peptidase_C39 like family